MNPSVDCHAIHSRIQEIAGSTMSELEANAGYSSQIGSMNVLPCCECCEFHEPFRRLPCPPLSET